VARGLAGLAWLQGQRADGVDAAAETVARLLQQCPDSPLVAEAAVLCGQSLEQASRFGEALDMYRVVADRYKSSPHASAAMLSAARLCDQPLKRDREAETLLRSWLETFPDSDERDAALYQLAWVLVDQGRDEEADPVFEQLRSKHRGSRYWADATYRLAERAVRAKDFRRAEELAAQIVDDQSPGSTTSYALFLRGQLAATAQRWEDCLRWMDRVLAEYPGSELQLSAEYWLAESHYRLRHYPQAGVLFDQLELATAGRDDAWLAMIPLRRAQVRAHAGQWNEAYEIARPIAERFPDCAQLHEVNYLLGRYFMNRAEFDEAREAYQSVVVSTTGAKTETAAMAQWMIGETYFMQREYNQAIKAYHRVEVLHSYPQWQAAALLQAGKCHEMLGQWNAATQLYSQILQTYPTTRVAEKATLRLRMARQRGEALRTR
jgi:TolA-binding protein